MSKKITKIKRPEFHAFIIEHYGTISQFARETGLARNTAIRYARGTTAMRDETIRIIAERTKTPVCAIIEMK
jgi:transcriptional regulator with XRE-family HTH domain